MKMIFTLLAAATLLFSAPMARAGGNDDCIGKDCQVHRNGVNRNVVPTEDYVCIFFVQPMPQRVTLRIDFRDGGSRYYDNKNNVAKNRICVGRHFVRDARFMMVCNDEAHADYEPEHVAIVAAKPAYSRKAEACLFGKDRCGAMGYLTRD